MNTPVLQKLKTLKTSHLTVLQTNTAFSIEKVNENLKVTSSAIIKTFSVSGASAAIVLNSEEARLLSHDTQLEHGHPQSLSPIRPLCPGDH